MRVDVGDAAGRRPRGRAAPASAGAAATARDLPVLVALVGVATWPPTSRFGAGQHPRADVSVVAVLGSLYPVVTVLLARVVPRRAARPAADRPASSLALAGVVLIAAG